MKTASTSTNPSALLVMAVLFKESTEKNPNYSFVDQSKQISNFGQSTTFDFHGTKFTNLLPLNREKYTTFDGSLTTPPCSPITKWVVFEDTLPISQGQLLHFGQIEDSKRQVVKQNWRMLQDLNDRKIFVNKPTNN